MAITLLALAVPLAGVAFMAKGLLAPPQKSTEESVDIKSAMEPLQRNLENIADHALGASGLSGGERRVTLVVRDVVAERGRVSALARDFGVTALPGVAGSEENRLLVQLPAGQADAFVRACEKRENQGGPSASSPSDSNEPRILVEVVVQELTP